jgi:uncharacterized protein YkwD
MEGKVTPKIKWLKLSLFLVFSVTLALVVFNPPYAPVVSAQAPANESTLIALTNAERLKSGLQSLNFNPQLYQAAVTKAEDIFQKQYFDHMSPSGMTPWQFILSSGYDYEYAGENLAIGFNDYQAVTEAWMESPTHRANILNPRYHDIAIAAVKGEFDGRETTVIVQMFGTKRPYILSNLSNATDTVLGSQINP